MSFFDEHLEEYINSHIDPEPSVLSEIYRHTHLYHLYPRMCSTHYQGRLLKMFAAMINPDKVLELGTYTGYSTLAMAEGMKDGAVIDTVEIDDEKEEELSLRFASHGGGVKINLHIGDALEVVKKLKGPYNLVFIDANKRNYQDYLEAVMPLVPTGGFIIADNTLWDMKLIDDRIKKDEQTMAIASFNDALAVDERFEKIILPVRDGLTIIRKVI